MDKKETAKLIVERLGGKENINMVTHCATRLRFDIKNKQEIQEENLNSMEEILGIVDKGVSIPIFKCNFLPVRIC